MYKLCIPNRKLYLNNKLKKNRHAYSRQDMIKVIRDGNVCSVRTLSSVFCFETVNYLWLVYSTKKYVSKATHFSVAYYYNNRNMDYCYDAFDGSWLIQARTTYELVMSSVGLMRICTISFSFLKAKAFFLNYAQFE